MRQKEALLYSKAKQDHKKCLHFPKPKHSMKDHMLTACLLTQCNQCQCQQQLTLLINTQSFWSWQCTVMYSIPLSPISCDPSPYQYLPGDLSALEKSNQTKPQDVFTVIYMQHQGQTVQVSCSCHNKNNNVHLSCTHQCPKHSHDTY